MYICIGIYYLTTFHYDKLFLIPRIFAIQFNPHIIMAWHLLNTWASFLLPFGSKTKMMIDNYIIHFTILQCMHISIQNSQNKPLLNIWQKFI